MKKVLLVALMMQSAVAFGSNDSPTVPFDATKNVTETMIITWKPVSNVQAACEAASRANGYTGFGFAVNACAFWKDNTCTVITKKNPTMHTLGHEVRHCFQGNWH